jgi:hypothetical protein
VNAVELALRKELALTRIRVARAELALARARPPDNLATMGSAVDLASTLLDGRPLGRWGGYARLFLRVLRVVLSVRGVLRKPPEEVPL